MVWTIIISLNCNNEIYNNKNGCHIANVQSNFKVTLIRTLQQVHFSWIWTLVCGLVLVADSACFSLARTLLCIHAPTYGKLSRKIKLKYSSTDEFIELYDVLWFLNSIDKHFDISKSLFNDFGANLCQLLWWKEVWENKKLNIKSSKKLIGRF